MNRNFISRQIDELGRIVIPIEIRKNLNIKVGDRIEFYTNGNSLILKKKYVNKTMKSILFEIENALNNSIDGDYIIIDKDRVLLSSDKSLKDLNVDLDVFASSQLDNKYTVFNNIAFIKDDNNYYVFKFYYDGNNYGFIILYNIDNVEKYLKLIKLIVTYINDRLSFS